MAVVYVLDGWRKKSTGPAKIIFLVWEFNLRLQISI
jgi:hypothetical protein